VEELCKVEMKKILAALDLSAYSENTFTHALDLARRYGAELVMFNVINDRGLEVLDRIQAEGYGVSRAEYVQKVQDERRQEFERDYLSRTGETTVRLVFKVGLPYEQILKYIRQENIDMVVLGTKGRNALAHALFGTTADKVYRRAGCLVLSVRGPEHCVMLG